MEFFFFFFFWKRKNEKKQWVSRALSTSPVRTTSRVWGLVVLAVLAPIKYRLSERYRQDDIAHIGSFLGLVAPPHKVAKVMGAPSPK